MFAVFLVICIVIVFMCLIGTLKFGEDIWIMKHFEKLLDHVSDVDLKKGDDEDVDSTN